MQKKNELKLPKKSKKLTEDEMRNVEGGDSGPIKKIGDWLRKHL